MVQGYYQLGGFQPQIKWFFHDEKKLAQTIAGDRSPLRVGKAPVELILGIKRCGTSHLLLTEPQTWDLVKRLRLPAPTAPSTPSTSFESLSPIEFWDDKELANKLGTLKPKAHKGRTPVDNSQTNKQYDANGVEGIHRAAFEHGRLLYQIMHCAPDLKKYTLNDASWMNSISICSFVFNTFGIDERTSEERLASPMIIDVGVTTGCVPDLDEMEGTMHFSLHRNLHLQGTRLPFKHGSTEDLGDSAIASRLQAFLEPRVDRHPTILLVHGEEISRNVLRNMGVDISAWQSGLKRLLGFDTPQVKNQAGSSMTSDPRRRLSAQPEHEYKHDSRSPHNSPSSFRGGYDQRQHRPRSRSRSPSRPQLRNNENYPAASSSRYDYPRRSPPRSRDSYGSARHNHHDQVYVRGPEAFAPVYVVDVQQLYKKLMKTEFGAESVAAIARQLRLTNDEGCCAGNEAVMLIEIWRSMISGSTVDDQRTFRGALSVPLKSESADTKVSVKPPSGDSDEERDPNDIVQNPNPISSFADDPDSDDYGSSDSGF